MHQQGEQRDYTYPLIGIIFAGVIMLGIVLYAIQTKALGDLVVGFGVVGLLVVALSIVGVVLFKFFGQTKLSLDKERNRHIEAMVQKGLVPNGHRYLPSPTFQLKPDEPQQISAPRPPASQIIFNPNALRESAVNLLLFSMRQCGADQNRIASGPECAAAGINGYSGRTWSLIVHDYLEKNWDVVTVPGAVANGGGTYVQNGTVGELYHKVMLNSAVDQLPENKR